MRYTVGENTRRGWDLNREGRNAHRGQEINKEIWDRGHDHV